jgi:hypothetical protein
MFCKSFKAAALAAIVGCLAFGATSAKAGSVIHSGDTVDGWKITFPVGIGLFNDGLNGNTLDIEKEAAFTSMEGLVITFTQTCYSAAPDIAIVNENLTNVTGQTWNGFQFLLTSPLAPPLNAATFTTTFNEIAPFTSETMDGAADTVTLGGGSVPNYDTALIGYDPDGGDLTIAANPSHRCLKQVFALKELPLGGPMVPLPAAAWSGLTSLLGLALISKAKNLKKILA